MGWNGLDLLNDFSAELGDVSSGFKTKVLRWINEGIRDISTAHNWPFLREKGKVFLAQNQDTHSIVLARPSAPTLEALAGGSLTADIEYRVLVTFYEAHSQVESIAGDYSAIVPSGTDLAIKVSDIPVSDSPLVIERRIYVSKNSGSFQYHGKVSNNIEATEATTASLVSQGVTYTALTEGEAGNSITVEIIDSTAGGLSYTETDGNIIIDLGGETADVDAIVALLEGSVFVLATGEGSGAVAVAAQASLENGADLTPVTYEITTDTSSMITPPDENAIHMLDGDLFIEGMRVLCGTSVQDLTYSINGINASGTPTHWAPVNEEEVLVYPKPSQDTVVSFYYFKRPARVFGTVTSVPQIPSWLYEDLRRYVLWRGYEFRDRAGKESKQLNYENGLRLTISRRGRALKKSGRVRVMTPDSDGMLS